MQLAGFSHVALTVTGMPVSKMFYADVLGLTVLDSSESYCALLVGGDELAALILTSHADGVAEAFSEFRRPPPRRGRVEVGPAGRRRLRRPPARRPAYRRDSPARADARVAGVLFAPVATTVAPSARS
jgi:catechol 2,3-dioxygenase-like lactoylglutathione lyase family enzyme